MPNIHDVALHAGVSATTVSRYLNNRIELPPATAARIDAAVASLDYRPNLLARHLSTGRTEAASLVVPDLGNPFFAELAAAIESEAARHGYAVFMCSSRGDREREIAAMQRLRSQHVDGLILISSVPDDGTLADLIGTRNRTVIVEEDVPDATAPRLFVDNHHGTYLATRHLIENGHASIGYLGGAIGLSSTAARRAGFEQAMTEAGLPVVKELMHFSEHSRGFGRIGAQLLLEATEAPTAIVASSDYIAFGVIQELTERGLSLPDDMSIIGFDDLSFSDLTQPALTTIRQPVGQLGTLAFRTLLNLLNGAEMDPVVTLPVELVERRSVTAPRRRTLPR